MKINSIIDLVKDLDTSRQTKNLNKLLIRILLHLQVEFSFLYMTKAEIVSRIAQQTGIEKEVVMTVVEAFMENVKDAMIAGNEVFLRGFGSFIIKQRAEKVARNISKNTTIVIPAHSIPAFKPAKVFLSAVKEGK